MPAYKNTYRIYNITEEEVEKTTKAMPLDKAPGPDGFTGRLYASCWGIIKHDIMRAFGLFYHGDMHGLPGSNRSLVSLLPMVDGAMDIRVFGMVSLVHGAINFFDKVLQDLRLSYPSFLASTKVRSSRVGLCRIISCFYNVQRGGFALSRIPRSF